MIEIKIDTEKLVRIINEHSVEVSHYGFTGFKMKVINAKKLFDVLHEVADCDKETFIDFVNTSNNPKTWMDREKYKRNSMIDALFLNIESQGMFSIAGFEELGGDDHFIPHIKISELIPLTK